jgi:hypothetical protein
MAECLRNRVWDSEELKKLVRKLKKAEAGLIMGDGKRDGIRHDDEGMKWVFSLIVALH